MSELTPRVRAWEAQGRRETVEDHAIFVHRTEGADPLVLLLHGFPSSSYDWRGVLAGLGHRATLSLDFLGFGLSDKPREATYSLFTQADIVEALLAGAQRPVVMVAHDMGTSVATELLARAVEHRLGFPLQAALLFNGNIILELASLTWAQRVLRSPAGPLLAAMSNRRAFTRQFAALFSAAHPLAAAEGEDQWALWARAGGARMAHRLIHYLDERETYAERWHGAIRDWDGPLSFAWGMHDPVATPRVLEGLRRLRPQAPVTELAQLGHYPQIEDPEAIAALVRGLG